MSDEEILEEEEIETTQILTNDDIKKYSSNRQIIKFIRKKFKRLNLDSAMQLIKLLLWRTRPIRIEDITKAKSFKQYNLSKIENDVLKKDFVDSLLLELNGFLKKIGKEQIDFDEKNKIDLYKLNNHSEYIKIRKYLCDERGDIEFIYDFDKNIIEKNTFDNRDTLQKNIIQVMSTNLRFDYPLEYKYSCLQCGNEETRKAYQTICTNNKLLCTGMFEYENGEGELKRRPCRLQLVPDLEVSFTKSAYYYDINYDDPLSGEKQSAGAISFLKLLPGFYECVFFKINQPKKTDLIQIMDIKKIKPNVFKLPEQKKDENYVFTLQKSFDEYIKNQTGMAIWGMIPIKVTLILQKILTELKMILNGNIQIVGDASTGKSTVLKYYGFLLNNNYHLSSSGVSISVPALRGTKTTITLLGKDNKIVTTGHLGSYKSIHIDEAGENKNLVQNLKTFLLETNYSYDRAGSTGIFHKRTAQINLSENLSYDHLGQYRGSIKKAYKDSDIIIEGVDKEEWDEEWDLHLPLSEYSNPYLKKIIEDKRIEYRLKQMWWIDGYDYALHERFLFYFYLVNNNENENLSFVIKKNTMKKIIEENFELMKALKTENIDNFFSGLDIFYIEEGTEKYFDRVDKILKQYNIHTNARINKFYYNVLKLSRIINRRKHYEEMDFDLLKYILENTNRKLDVSDTNNYEIRGPPNFVDVPEESITKTKNKFGLPDGEFN